MIAALACLVLSAPPVPHSMLFSFDRFALYGPVASLGRVYPLDKEERPQAAVGPAVEVDLGDDPPEGDYVLRMPFDEAALPEGARPAHVRVLVKTLFTWSEAPARLRKGPGGHHALFVPVEAEGVYAVVLGGGPGHAPIDDLLSRELERFRTWVAAEGGTDVTAAVEPELIQRLGRAYGADLRKVRIVRARPGPRATAVLDGLLAFFEGGEGRSMRALTLGERVYVFGGPLLGGEDDPGPRRRALARELWHVVQWRRLGEGYWSAWAKALIEVGLKGHSMEVEADHKADEALSHL